MRDLKFLLELHQLGVLFGFTLTENAATNTPALQLLNPAGSGKRVIVFDLIAQSPDSGSRTIYASRYDTILTDAASGYIKYLHNNTAPNTAHLIAKSQEIASVLTSGMFYSRSVDQHQDFYVLENFPFVLDPGQGLMVQSNIATDYLALRGRGYILDK